jgi:branched-subunit amino acid aminotransferase/4-amino-4-deoxychorismate lyase
VSDFELYEALLWEPDAGYFLLERHLARLAASAAHFGRSVDLDAVRAALLAHARSMQAAVKVRLMVPAHGALRIEAAPLKPSTTVRAALATEPVADDDPFLRHKTSRREVYARALAARPDVDDVILWNRHGELTETCNANLLLRLDGELLTPHAAAGLLPGTYRAELLERGTIREARLGLDELKRASELALINSVRRRCPVELVA